MKSSDFSPRIETTLIANRLLQVAVGETVTYEDLAVAAGASVRPGSLGYAWLQSARKRTLVDRAFFETVAGVGLRRLSNEEWADYSCDKHHKKTKNLVRRSATEINAVDYSSLPTEKRRRVDVERTRLAFAKGLHSVSSQRKLSAAAEASAHQLTAIEAIEILKGEL